MKINRAFTILIVMFLTLSSITFINPVRADEDPEPNLNVNAYVNDPDSPGHGHDEVASSGETEITVGSDDDLTSVANKLSLSAQPRYVQTVHDGSYTEVTISVSGAGFGENDSYASSSWSEFLNPHKVELYAQQSNFDGNIDILTSNNRGINTDGEVAEGSDFNHEQAELAFGAASFLPVVGNFFGGINFAMTVKDAIEENPNKMIEEPTGASGPNAIVGGEWFIEEKDETLSGYGEDEYEDRKGVGFGFSTEIIWRIYEEDWNDDNLELDIWAEMENSLCMTGGKGGTEYIDGAETDPITVTIRNAEIESVESEYTDSGNIMLSTSNGEKYWDDTIDVTLVNEPEDFEVYETEDVPYDVFPIPQVDVTVDWGDGETYTKSGWKPYNYTMDIESDPRTITGEYIEKELSPSLTYDLDEPGDTEDFTITITVESPGGWEMSESYDISIEYIDNDDGGGNGGGGGGGSGGGGNPPPHLPWGDDTRFEEK